MNVTNFPKIKVAHKNFCDFYFFSRSLHPSQSNCVSNFIVSSDKMGDQGCHASG